MKIAGTIKVPKELQDGTDLTKKKQFMIDYCTNMINKHDTFIQQGDVNLTISLSAKETVL